MKCYASEDVGITHGSNIAFDEIDYASPKASSRLVPDEHKYVHWCNIPYLHLIWP